MENSPITIQASVAAPIEKVWALWSGPEHIMKWNNASPDWHTPFAENDLRTGGSFRSTMAARDGSMSFDFEGTYTDVEEPKLIAYLLADGRRVNVIFQAHGNDTKVIETFDPESMNPREMQQAGWQAILDNFKKYVEEYA